MSLRWNVYNETEINTTLWATKTPTDLQMAESGKGSSKNERQAAMCVVNKYGLIGSKTRTSKVPIIVNNKITDIVATIGPMELSVKQDKQMDKELTVNSAKNATANPPK